MKKSYHAPQTPYQRLLACAEVTAADKKKLQRQYQQLNPAALKRELDKQRKELIVRRCIATAQFEVALDEDAIDAESCWLEGQ